MRLRRLAVSVVVTDLAGTTAQDDIAHATREASLHLARRLDVAVGANLARGPCRQSKTCRFGKSMVSNGEGIVNDWPPNAGLIGHVDTSRDNGSDATCPRR
ncbi:MAG: hypothetical protein OXI95_11055 [bacterium]|nr:hypothetical protein [bacterium]